VNVNTFAPRGEAMKELVQAAQEVAALLQRGGEAAPVLRVELPAAAA
jgi:hypothetical protein